jgi:hypothetical protein
MLGVRSFLALLAAVALAGVAHASATFVILNADGPGVGLNDPTPVAPVGGNPGTTLGQQRLNVLQQAGQVWGSVLTSVPAIVVQASSVDLACPTAGGPSAVGAPAAWLNAFYGPRTFLSAWYPVALANKIALADQNGASPEITLQLNLQVGTAGCVPEGFYYGLDGNHGAQIDLLFVVLHELVHGLGFATTTNPVTGVQMGGYPAVFDEFVYDDAQLRSWPQMTDAQRATSARNARNVVWIGANATNAAKTALAVGTPRIIVGGPMTEPGGPGTLPIGLTALGPPLGPVSVSGQLMTVIDTPEGYGRACDALDPLNALSVSGDVAVLWEDPIAACSPTTQVKNAQDAGAIGVVLVAASPSTPPADLFEIDPTISIPTVRVSGYNGPGLLYGLSHRSRTASGLTIDLGMNATQLRGADTAGRPLLFTSDPPQDPAHWDATATPDQLMEPVVAGDLTLVNSVYGMSLGALQDLGW